MGLSSRDRGKNMHLVNGSWEEKAVIKLQFNRITKFDSRLLENITNFFTWMEEENPLNVIHLSQIEATKIAN